MRLDPRRSLLALLLAGAFGFRVVATPVAWGCMTGGGPTTAASHGQHHQHGHQSHGSPPPACECLAHAPGTAVTVQRQGLDLAAARPVSATRGAILQQTLPAGAQAHVLPFSIGPPSPLA
jgi:hypothetical protein